MIDEREKEDGVILDETTLSIMVDGQEIELYTAQNFNWEETRDVEVRLGPGRKKGKSRKVRKSPTYSLSMELDEPNHALLVNPDEMTETDRGAVTKFVIGGEEYTTLMDLPPFTITNRNPDQDGNKMIRKFFNCEFTKNSGSIAIGEAAKRNVDLIATRAEGLI